MYPLQKGNERGNPECATQRLPPLTDAELEPGRIAGAARREQKRREREEFTRRLRDHEANERHNREEDEKRREAQNGNGY